ncbi:YciI family protein [Streptomyces sp. NBC_01497]|uniref:YciI family protein n=1 Tax=Streptomyces sp. NBC_01497 TaxID=2903885 RepID=UPI002E32446E|nr:YciI family protein [Streptomyces sp. NBC_01497]
MPRYLMLVRTDENNAPAGGPSEGLMERMGALIEDLTKSGHMLDTGGLLPTAQGARVGQEGGRVTVTDGPFTETKEVIGGYALIQAKDREQAIELARRFVEIHEPEWNIVSEVRQIVEP